jgi:nucleoid-associated protein YgaU
MRGVPRSALWISAAVLTAAVAGVIAWQVQMPSPIGTAAPPAAPTGGPQVSSSVAPKPEPTVAAAEPLPAEEIGKAAPAPVPGPGAVANAAPNPEQSTDLPVALVPAAKSPAPVPQFDVVRVEPDGSAVIAGRAAPEAAIVLLDRGQPFDRATADGAGQFALAAKQLAAGQHLLSLRIASKDGTYTDSTQSVSVWIPASGQGDVLVALTNPGEPTRILSDIAQAPPQDRNAAALPPALAIRSAEVEGLGSFFATGFAPAGAKILLYLNNAFVASVTASADNQWSLKVEKGMRPGGYTIRADQVEGGNGRVIARAEAPFNYPAAPRLAQNQSDPPTSLRLAPVNPNRVPQTKSGLVASLSSGSSAATARASEASHGPAKIVIPTVAARASAQKPAVETVQTARAAPETTMPAPHLQASIPNEIAMATESDTKANAVIKELGTALVERGDSLWRISRKVYGRGMRYTQIYEANAVQIRDPDLIYPGQIFVVPNSIAN